MIPWDDDGRRLDASFAVSADRGSELWTLVVESRSGRRGSPQQRNADYGAGLELLLRRLAALGASLVDAAVDSATARRLEPSPDARRLRIPGGYPNELVARQAAQLRADLGRAAGEVARRPGAKGGGNREKRVRLWLDVPGWEDGPEELATMLAGNRTESPEPARATRDERRAGRSQGRAKDAAFRRAVEVRAMALAIAHYEGEGWSVENTSETHPFDLLCCSPEGQRLRVEVKGTTGLGRKVTITTGEVANARAFPQETALFVVSGIEVVLGHDGPCGRGGLVREHRPWNLDAGTLRATTYEWSPS